MDRGLSLVKQFETWMLTTQVNATNNANQRNRTQDEVIFKHHRNSIFIDWRRHRIHPPNGCLVNTTIERIVSLSSITGRRVESLSDMLHERNNRRHFYKT